ncbi:MAG: DNA alkylation response protein, partial [Brevibacterium yomogidense]
MTAEADSRAPDAPAWPVPDSHGIDRVADDKSLQALLPLYLDDDLRSHLAPVLAELGPRLGGEM